MQPYDDERPGLFVPPPEGTEPHPQPSAGILPTSPGSSATALADLGRAGDTGAGHAPELTEGQSLTAADRQAIRLHDDARIAEERQRLEEMLASESALFNLPASLTSPLVVAALLGVLAILGLFVFSQVTSTLSSLNALPTPVQYLGWFALALLVLAVLYAIGRFLFFFVRLRPNQPVRLKSLSELSHRTHLRWLVQEKRAEAKAQLEGYLQAYPFDANRDRAVLIRLGLLEEQLNKLRSIRDDLLDPNRFAGTDQWFADFRSRFQTPLDEAATVRISYFARRIAVMTAASPNALIDTVLTAYCSFSMLADLCRIYNLRVTWLGTAVLLVRVFFNSYLAGQLHEFEKVTETGIQSLLNESGVHFGSLALDATAGKLIGKVGARAASGALNFFMLKRLGNYAARLLRPVHAA